MTRRVMHAGPPGPNPEPSASEWRRRYGIPHHLFDDRAHAWRSEPRLLAPDTTRRPSQPVREKDPWPIDRPKAA